MFSTARVGETVVKDVSRILLHEQRTLIYWQFFRVESGKVNLSGILCARHNMTTERSMYATETQEGHPGRGGIAVDSAGID
jgi:hypothetical protein